MKLSTKRADMIITILWCLLVVLFTLLWASTRTTNKAIQNEVISLANAMYDFDTPQDLLAGQERLKASVSAELWDQLKVDNELRAISAYFKFKYSASNVNIVKSYPNAVVYTLDNDNINLSEQWLIIAEKGDSDVFTDVREYKLICNGGSIGINGFR